MDLWRPFAADFLDALLRREGLGKSQFCRDCRASGAGVRLFRCDQCGGGLQCETCLRSRHALTPLHCITEWNGQHWVQAKLSGGVGTLQIIYQVGHDGHPCDHPGPVRSMVVIDVTGIHHVRYRYCGCEEGSRVPLGTLGQLMGHGWYPATITDPETCATFEVLEWFRLLSVVGNINVHDFVGSLERKMDSVQIADVPDRYKAFGRMARQYAYLLRAKRAGCGHTPSGLSRAGPGALAVPCWACPHDGKNLPEGWKEITTRFLYMLLLAMDANFRLKNKLRKNEHQDPSLGSGLGYFVEERAYKEHVKNYVAEKDVSSCIAFAALLQKETRLTTGLRCSGVGGCVCARHGVVRPQGLGDLQKGERYANMDYILMSALLGVAVLLLAISYDIVCQWKLHLLRRAKAINEKTSLQTRLEDFEIVYALPVWHAAAHETSCQTENSLSYTVGVGRTDGEGIERTWAVLNPLGFSTKEMGNGARHDAIENKVDHLNFEKNVGQSDTLAWKLIVAITERDKQVAAFEEIDGSLHPRLQKKWQKQIDDWVADRTKPNPYCPAGGQSAGPSEASVLRELKDAEAREAEHGRDVFADLKSTPAAFIKAGLVLEESQRRMKAELKGVTLVTADRASQIQELRNSFMKKLRTFERMQAMYMPGVASLKEAAEEAHDADSPPTKAEDVRLWLLSELLSPIRCTVCRKGLAEVEAKLREAQCADALGVVRSRLHAQTHLISWRNSNAVGQRAATRSATLIGRVGDRIARVADKYRHARRALIELKGASYAPQFKELTAADLNTNIAEESDAQGRKKLARLGSKKRARNEPSNARKNVSWIWVVGGGPDEDAEKEIHDSVRVEWSKAKARRDRWVEEVQLLREEMKRVLRMLRWTQQEWQGRVDGRDSIDTELRAGLAAYAQRQVYVHRQIAEAFERGWSCSMASAVRQVMERDGHIYRELLHGSGVDQAPDLGLGDVESTVSTSS
ncbi:hypothetical protein B0H12DRAFT_1063385 [Mycena haematopus]|nr:hypothetical protein B0H12DRAFT_1063385 [Mycena haematopus]